MAEDTKGTQELFKLLILSIPDVVMLPLERKYFTTDDPIVTSLIEEANESWGSLIGILCVGQRIEHSFEPIGTLCLIDKDNIEFSEGAIGFYLQGQLRFRIVKILKYEDVSYVKYPTEAEVEILREDSASQSSLNPDLIKRYRMLMSKAKSLNPSFLPSIEDLSFLTVGQLADKLAGSVGQLLLEARLWFLENLNPFQRFQKILFILENAFEDLEKDLAKRKNRFPVACKNDKNAGQHSENKDLDELNERFNKIKNRLPEEGRKKIEDEIHNLERMDPHNSFYSTSFIWVDSVLSLFSLEPTEECKDVRKIKQILNEDHYGLNKIKERIIQYMAVKILNPKQKSPILCFVGPPGVGKTSLGQSIARSLGRKFIRLSIGGVHDEAEIRGHRATYVNALPGRIIDAIKNSGSSNPLFMIDEVDKIGQSHNASSGDPESALLEVLDPEQNHKFVDHYIGIGFDLSKVFFIVTANIIETILPALKDRLEILTLPGYSEEEKIHIARQFLIPRQLEENGLVGEIKMDFQEEALKRIINEYTRESGVRNLERKVAEVFRQLAIKVLENPALKSFSISAAVLPEFLGPKKYFKENLRKRKSGVSIGMAWTPYGGEILFIESAIVAREGKGKLILTGQLGEVMEESAKIARSYLRTRIHSGCKEKLKNDIHIHVPAGAIPKDGPSAGLAILFSLYSLYKSKPSKEYLIKENLAVTGEITLRGDVLPVGGIKEKIIGAVREGIKEIILPKNNEGDLIDLPESIRKNVLIHLVSNIEEALDAAFPQRKRKTKET